jgi:hypothetical protein
MVEARFPAVWMAWRPSSAGPAMARGAVRRPLRPAGGPAALVLGG